jgi:hypothetical protein
MAHPARGLRPRNGGYAPATPNIKVKTFLLKVKNQDHHRPSCWSDRGCSFAEEK